MINQKNYLILLGLIAFVFADPPTWDVNGDGVLDNYNDYENNGSVTAMVSTDGANSFGSSGDMIAAFVGDEQRGVGLASLVPFGPYAGTYQFQMMIYSNASDGENLSFQYYDVSSDQLYILNENFGFTVNMVIGDVLSPYIFNFEEIDDGGGDGNDAGDLAYEGTPIWDVNGDGVLDNYNDYENNGSVTAMVSTDSVNSFGSSGDMIAAFVGDEQRGVGLASLVPFGPYEDTYQFQMMIYSNVADGETLSFQYYDQSLDAVYNLAESFSFETNMVIGNVVSPYIFTFTPGDSTGPDPVYGCTDSNACNYDSDATSDDASCDYAEVYYDCDNVCLSDSDLDGICDELEISGCTNPEGLNYDSEATDDDGSCLLLGCTDIDACNYDQDATADNDSCEYAQENFDCDGNCIVNTDCVGECGGTAEFDECDVCDDLPWNDCIQDCSGAWGGDAIVDECGICDGQGSIYECGCADILEGNCDCEGNVLDACGICNGPGDIYECGCNNILDGYCDCEGNILDECDVCGGDDFNNNGLCDPICPENYTLNPLFPNVSESSYCVPDLFIHNVSTVSAGYLFQDVTIEGNNGENNDWVGAFNDNVCVGAQVWNTDECSGNICSINVMGNDGSSFTQGYMTAGSIPTFKIYDASENIYYDAYPTDEVAWENFGFSDIDLLSTLIHGCTDIDACNYNLEAIVDDTSCEFAENNYDCNGDCIADIDCAGECGGSSELDDCGECDGNNSICSGCTDSEALNYDEAAIVDNGSCIFDFDLAPELFEYNQSTQQAFYFFEVASINNVPLDENDWLAAFNGDICVGSKKWDTLLCGDGVCDLPIMGDDGADYSNGYMQSGDIPTFKVYDYSEQTFYDAIPSENISWISNEIYILDYVNVFYDCADILGGNTIVDECGVCDGDNSTCLDCAGVPNGDSLEDECGVCDGDNSTCLDCAGVPNGDSLADECGVCDGDNSTCLDCAGVPNGDSLEDQCGTCDSDSENDCIQDCNGDFGGNAVLDCGGECGGSAMIDDCGVCNEPENLWNDEQDCAGVCFGDAVVDECGVCDGDNSTCLDCAGVPNGDSLEDQCGICDGDNLTCSGCTDLDALNYDEDATLEDGSCYFTLDVNLSLHEGANLVSFFALPSELDIETFTSSIFNNINGLITESSSAYLYNNNLWIGSLLSISESNGYWFLMEDQTSFSVDGYPIGTDFEYSLHQGANLISFPAEGVYNVEDIIPENLQGTIYGIIAEGESALYTNGSWIGLESFVGGKGYWLKTYEDLSFSFDINPIEYSMAKDIVYEQRNNKLTNFEYIQSSEQAFYFVETIENASIGDWIIAYNGNTVIGTREWNGQAIDIPVMGFMNNNFDYSLNYCKEGDIPKFKLYKKLSGELINLEGNINAFHSNGLFLVGKLYEYKDALPSTFGINNVYPNPFNPIATIDFMIPKYTPLTIKILNLQGRVVDTIIEKDYEPGNYSIQYNAADLSSGIYFIELKNDIQVSYSKIILLK